MRTRFFPAEIFGEPAWDLILSTYVAAKGGKPVRVRQAHLSACVAPSIAEARVRRLAGMGILVIEPIKPGSRARQALLTVLAEEKLERLLEETWFERHAGHAALAAPKASHRSSRLRAIADILIDCRAELDSLEAWLPGAHLSQVISALEES